METIADLKIVFAEKTSEVTSKVKVFTSNYSRPIYWFSVFLMSIGGLADLLLVSNAVLSPKFLIFSGILGSGILMYKAVAGEKTPETIQEVPETTPVTLE